VRELEQRVLDAIDMDGLTQALCDFIAIRSLDGEETAAQEFSADLLTRCGLTTDVWEIDFNDLRRHPAFSCEVQRQRGLGVVGAMGEDRGGRSLILNGHVDVVPAGDPANWQYPPWQGTVANGRVYGRGSTDMKGGVCCAIFAAKAIRDANVRLQGKLLIEAVIGEEDGGVGTLATVLRGYRADGAIIMEPTELAIAPAQAGALNFRITIPGLSAHGCVREEGVSAIEKLFPIYQALMNLEQRINERHRDPLFARYQLPYPLCVGTIQAGNWPSTVAESLSCEGRYGIPVGADITAARQEFEAAVATAAQADPWLREHPPQLQWWGGQFEPASIPTDHPLVHTVAAAFETSTGKSPCREGMPYGADMRLLVNVGQTPTVMFGPGNVRHAHQPDEFVPIDDLRTVTQTLALTALQYCGVVD
jgi:acetylornithine deacetylase